MNNEEVIKIINMIPGQKIVTLLSPNSLNKFMTIDVSENGEWGYNPVDLAMFLAKLNSAIQSEYGNVIIRQFLPTMFKDGIPNKIVYGIIFNKGEMRGIHPDQLEWACEHHCETGEYIGKEDGVSYGNLFDKLVEDDTDADAVA